MKKKIEKEFDAVKYMRQQRDEISKVIADMNFKEIKEYLKKRRKKGRVLPGC
jgi:hypothetical protein